MKPRKKTLPRPSASDLAEIARGKGSARDKREARSAGLRLKRKTYR